MRAALLCHMFLAAAVAVAQPPPPIPPAADHARPAVVRTGDSLTVADGKFADVTVDVPAGAQVVWRIYPPPLQRADKLPPGRAIFAGERGKSYVVTAMVIDFGKKTVTDTEFTVAFAGKAEPKPDPRPDPKPDPDDDKKKGAPTGTLFVAVVEETSARTPEIARVLNDLAYWTGLAKRDVRFRFYDKDSPDPAAKSYRPHADRVGLPAVLVLDPTGDVLDAKRLPATTAGIDAILKGVGR